MEDKPKDQSEIKQEEPPIPNPNPNPNTNTNPPKLDKRFISKRE